MLEKLKSYKSTRTDYKGRNETYDKCLNSLLIVIGWSAIHDRNNLCKRRRFPGERWMKEMEGNASDKSNGRSYYSRKMIMKKMKTDSKLEWLRGRISQIEIGELSLSREMTCHHQHVIQVYRYTHSRKTPPFLDVHCWHTNKL